MQESIDKKNLASYVLLTKIIRLPSTLCRLLQCTTKVTTTPSKSF